MPLSYPESATYPIVDSDPGVWKSFQKFRGSDWAFVAQTTTAFTVIGYYMGRSTYLHRPTAFMGGFMGVTFGLAVGLQESLGRQMGLKENAFEVEAAKAESA